MHNRDCYYEVLGTMMVMYYDIHKKGRLVEVPFTVKPQKMSSNFLWHVNDKWVWRGTIPKTEARFIYIYFFDCFPNFTWAEWSRTNSTVTVRHTWVINNLERATHYTVSGSADWTCFLSSCQSPPNPPPPRPETYWESGSWSHFPLLVTSQELSLPGQMALVWDSSRRLFVVEKEKRKEKETPLQRESFDIA